MALANKVNNMAGDLVKFETTPKHSSASNLAERAIQAVEERSRTIRADCQMRSSETFGANKPIWEWLLRHAGWQISRYKPKGNGMTAHKQAHGEHYTHEVVPFAEIVLVRVPKPTHRGLQGGKRWHKGDAVFIKGVWVGRSDLSEDCPMWQRDSNRLESGLVGERGVAGKQAAGADELRSRSGRRKKGNDRLDEPRVPTARTPWRT